VTAGQPLPRQHTVRLPAGGPALAVREFEGSRPGGRPFLLVHGLASNARLWDGVGGHLAAAGHRVVAVDLRGHGLSEEPPAGYDTDTNADDLAALAEVAALDAPVVAGQSWGGNVVLSLAARHPGVAAAVACVDGGWLRPSDSFATFEECWAVLAPPVFDGVRYEQVERGITTAHPDWPAGAVAATLANLVEVPGGGVRAHLSRDHHKAILRSLFDGDPAAWYPRIDVPVLLVPAVGPDPVPGEGPRAAASRAGVREALAALPRGDARWYAGADHDLHAQHPARLAADLLALEATLTDREDTGMVTR
jgi:pimeloyl-ACP methyl ester carboxylesterase